MEIEIRHADGITSTYRIEGPVTSDRLKAIMDAAALRPYDPDVVNKVVFQQ